MFNSDFDSVSLPNKKPGLIFAEQNCLVQTSVLLKTKRQIKYQETLSNKTWNQNYSTINCTELGLNKYRNLYLTILQDLQPTVHRTSCINRELLTYKQLTCCCLSLRSSLVAHEATCLLLCVFDRRPS